MTKKESAAPESLPDGAIPAATLVIMRPAESGGADEILLVKRASNMAFAAGAIVFPGGRIDPDDYHVARLHGFSDANIDGAARVASVRETLEETGLGVAWNGLAGRDIGAVRQALQSGTLLSEILASRSETLDLNALVPFARWCPNFKETRTFDTRFYAIDAPQQEEELSFEVAELSHLFWASAQETLEMADRGDVSVIFPTRRNLERLAATDRFREFAEHAAQFPPRLITPWIEERGGEPHLCIPDGLGYPITAEAFAKAKRG
jgi:8-oxo-dGTP pyrophosphatase MutT (NUDIX family)